MNLTSVHRVGKSRQAPGVPLARVPAPCCVGIGDTKAAKVGKKQDVISDEYGES